MSDAPALMPVAEVDRILAAQVLPTAEALLPLAEAAGRVLRQAVLAERPSPPFHRAAMDGICVASAALAAGQRRFRVAGTQRAGQEARGLPAPDVCLEIMTGAVLPAGADVVIQIEHVALVDGVAELPADYSAPPMQNVHQMGSDHAAGDRLLAPGRVLGPAQIAILASCGVAHAAVHVPPRAAVVATGDELVPVSGPVAPHQIRMSNVHAIAAGLAAAGCTELRTLHLHDELDILRRDLALVLDAHDLVILSGGISVGRYDYVGQVLEELGVTLHVTKVQQRPGKPLAFGTRASDGTRVFALPGNPVSATVCLRRYVLPYLRAAAGERPAVPVSACLTQPYRFKPKLTLFLPVTFGHDPAVGLTATPAPTNGSGDWGGLGETDGFVEIPAGQHDTPVGARLAAFPWAAAPFA